MQFRLHHSSSSSGLNASAMSSAAVAATELTRKTIPIPAPSSAAVTPATIPSIMAANAFVAEPQCAFINRTDILIDPLSP